MTEKEYPNCPACGSEHIKTTWCEPIGLPECEVARCYDCCHSWVRCAAEIGRNM